MNSATADTGVKKRAGRDGSDAESLPSAEDIAVSASIARSLVGEERHGRIFAFLRSLAATPPRCLMLEGGDAAERAGVALYWGMLLNCPERTGALAGEAPPCLACPSCLKFLARMHRDLFFLDGAASSITIDEVRAVRGTFGEAAREAAFRVVILSEAQSLTEAAANALLKSLEEALPTTVFVLTAPQRERLLPTLVSRSWVLTLAWPNPLTSADDTGAPDSGELGWSRVAAAFLATGRGLFERTGVRGGIDAAGANALILVCQRAMVQALSGLTVDDVPPGKSPTADLARFFASLPPGRLAAASAVLHEGQESLAFQVSPGLVADWVMTRLYLLRPASRK